MEIIITYVSHDCSHVSSTRSHDRRLHKVLPYLTSAFETIDKAHLKNSLAKYVTHLPRTINPERRERLRKGGTYDEIRREQTERSETYGAFHPFESSRIRGKGNGFMHATIFEREKLSLV